ncbi:hypothetical protein WN51_10251 [Melipona quadrifasciata]|uniref:Uncharacterized protein n=1 Tax=Melipona quadrifasciata TaxID=166423 RepID=A0A0N0BI42_9HYME|nr:hypothetical protein WN51_10251 [Melipona quadrifasciata]
MLIPQMNVGQTWSAARAKPQRDTAHAAYNILNCQRGKKEPKRRRQRDGAIAQYQTTPRLLEVYATPPHESRDPNQPIANFRCISVAPEEVLFHFRSELKLINQKLKTRIKIDSNNNNREYWNLTVAKGEWLSALLNFINRQNEPVIAGKEWEWESAVRVREKAIVLRFVSESLPRLISGADGSDSLPQTLVVVTKPTRLVRTHPSGVPHTLLLNVEDRKSELQFNQIQIKLG